MSQIRQQARNKILQLAKQGDPKTIAALVERKLRNRGIAVRAERKEGTLIVILQGTEIPDEEELGPTIANAMKKLKAEGIQEVEVWGWQQGQARPDWVHRVTFDQASLKQALSAWLESSIVLPSLQSHQPERVQKSAGEEFLRFYLSTKDAALLPVSYVKEVLQVAIADILPVPHMSDRLLGAYNWRGEMLWLVDLDRLLGLNSTVALGEVRRSGFEANFGTTSAIALQVDDRILGLVVRRVEEIERHDVEEIEPATGGLFDAQLLPFVSGYLTEADALVLDAPAIFAGARQLGEVN
ncbi:MAG: chemotaxis protein CheW [Cyanobacteriota bacterium]|nr:chemotaxis protein CheW [Cyanobacteriota bacterium]